MIKSTIIKIINQSLLYGLNPEEDLAKLDADTTLLRDIKFSIQALQDHLSIINRDVKYIMMREFTYGIDVTEFHEGRVVLYDTEEEAVKSLKDYILSVNNSYHLKYLDDCSIIKALVSNDSAYCIESRRTYKLNQE